MDIVVGVTSYCPEKSEEFIFRILVQSYRYRPDLTQYTGRIWFGTLVPYFVTLAGRYPMDGGRPSS